jgi:hypothetical protein
MLVAMNYRERLAWLLELAPPEPEPEPPRVVRCPALGSIDERACDDAQDRGRLKACRGCEVGAEALLDRLSRARGS